MISKEAIKAAVSVPDYMEHQGLELRRQGASMRGPCPFCGGSDQATKFVVDDELWHCKGCGRGGDVISLHAEYTEQSFSRAVADLGQIFQVDETTLSLEALEERRLAREAKSANRVEEAELVRFTAQRTWSRLQFRSEAGERYLAKRGVPDAVDEVRFGTYAVCLPLYDFTGQIVNVVGRRFTGDGPKVLGLEHASAVGTFGDYSRFANQEHDIVVTEGFFDYLSARHLFSASSQCVLGVNGIANLPKVTAGLASVRQVRRCVLIPQNDEAAQGATAKAIGILRNWQFTDDRIVVKRIPRQFNDLNEMLVGGGQLE